MPRALAPGLFVCVALACAAVSRGSGLDSDLNAEVDNLLASTDATDPAEDEDEIAQAFGFWLPPDDDNEPSDDLRSLEVDVDLEVSPDGKVRSRPKKTGEKKKGKKRKGKKRKGKKRTGKKRKGKKKTGKQQGKGERKGKKKTDMADGTFHYDRNGVLTSKPAVAKGAGGNAAPN